MTNAELDQAAYDLKKERVEERGCEDCELGLANPTFEGFERLWYDEESYEPRRFVFKYTDPGASDVPVSKMKSLHYDTFKLREAMDRCVILCRACLARRERNEQCHEPTTSDSPTGSTGIGLEPLPA